MKERVEEAAKHAEKENIREIEGERRRERWKMREREHKFVINSFFFYIIHIYPNTLKHK